MSEITFEKWIKTTLLPSTAKDQLPDVLSSRLQMKLLKQPDAERIIASAIEDVNRGSVEALETLIRQKMKGPQE